MELVTIRHQKHGILYELFENLEGVLAWGAVPSSGTLVKMIQK